jgi:oligopeptide/dipeptide ABC transporter ATP-binding protein
MDQAETQTSLLAVRDLSVSFDSPAGAIHAVNGVSFELARGETLGIVGESGSGKSVTALAVLGLIAQPPGRVSGGGIFYEGRDLTRMQPAALRKIRGNRIAMIFQEPMTSLNPVFTIGRQIAEALELHLGMDRRQARNYAIGMLEKVGIPLPAQRIDEYPHQLSGGMRQRVMIAMALSCKPQILLADEPTTALDVTIQAQIVDLMLALQKELGTAILLISHDMGLVAETCDRVAVMYAGRIVEEAGVNEIFAQPQHPYTAGLLKSVPRLRTERGAAKVTALPAIPGMVPSPARLPPGCAFAPRCAKAMSACSSGPLLLRETAPGHRVRCKLYD